MTVGLTTILKFAVFIVAIVFSISIFIKAKRTDLNSLVILGFIFIMFSIMTLVTVMVDFEITTFFSSKTLYITLAILLLLLYSVFTHYTFYTAKKSPFKWLFLISVVGLIASELLFLNAILTTGSFTLQNDPLSASHINFTISYIILALLTYLLSGWRFKASLDSYNEIKGNIAVKGWIRLKYKLVMVTCVMQMLVSSLQLLDYSLFKLLIIMVLVLSNFILEILAWGAPIRLRKWANRKYQIEDESASMSEEEIIAQFEGDKS
jgi:hypothetical protein